MGHVPDLERCAAGAGEMISIEQYFGHWGECDDITDERRATDRGVLAIASAIGVAILAAIWAGIIQSVHPK